MSETKEPWEVGQLERKNTMETKRSDNIATTKTREKRMVWQRQERSGNHKRMQVLWKHADAMRMMRWRMQQTNKTHGGNKIHGRRLKRRSRGVTTLHRYKRISSRDLGWHRREKRKRKRRGKLSCFFDKRVKPKNLERLNNLKERIQQRWMWLKTLR